MSLSQLRRQWNAHGRRDALTAILTRRSDEPAWDFAAFLETGRRDIARLMFNANRLVPALDHRRALDFGCGIGRLTCALADHFDEVVGVDISDSMIAQALSANSRPDRVRYQLNVDRHLRRFPSGHFNLVCSWIVLQHMRPPLIRGYIAELLRVLAPGGLLVFQLPDANVQLETRMQFVDAPVSLTPIKRHLPPWLVRVYRHIKYFWYRRSNSYMAMHGLTADAVVALVDRGGGRVLEIQPDASHGTPCAGFSYWITR